MQLPDGLMDQVRGALATTEDAAGKKFGDPQSPLLVSVRSGAKFSMPGMMDTVLNLGLNETTLKGLIAQTSDERFAYDAYRRFIMMFSDIVLDLDRKKFDNIFDEAKKDAGVTEDSELQPEALKKVVERFKAHVKSETGNDFPDEPMAQLELAIRAVFNSWNNERAFRYREIEKIPHDLGTAVNVQTMVFGNMGNDSGTGVAFSCDPLTHDHSVIIIEAVRGLGEALVSGAVTPDMYVVDKATTTVLERTVVEQKQELALGASDALDQTAWRDVPAVQRTRPKLDDAQVVRLAEAVARVEHFYEAPQDIEWAYADDAFYVLQSRPITTLAHAH
jgi:phosphoenolpyruvate synthase/pyruvate phosphate dikinase